MTINSIIILLLKLLFKKFSDTGCWAVSSADKVFFLQTNHARTYCTIARYTILNSYKIGMGYFFVSFLSTYKPTQFFDVQIYTQTNSFFCYLSCHNSQIDSEKILTRLSQSAVIDYYEYVLIALLYIFGTLTIFYLAAYFFIPNMNSATPKKYTIWAIPKRGAMTIIRQAAPLKNAWGPSFFKILLRGKYTNYQLLWKNSKLICKKNENLHKSVRYPRVCGLPLRFLQHLQSSLNHVKRIHGKR